MLEIGMEFRKGILFIRLIGDLIDSTVEQVHKCFKEMIQENGVRYFVINLEQIQSLDQSGLEILEQEYSDILSREGKMMICGYSSTSHTKIPPSFLKMTDCRSNELAAFQLIHV